MIEINGATGLSPRSFRSDPMAYFRRLVSSAVKEIDPQGRPVSFSLYAVTSPEIAFHMKAYLSMPRVAMPDDPPGTRIIEELIAIGRALDRTPPPRLMTFDDIPVFEQPVEGTLSLFVATPTNAELVGVITNITL